MSAALLFEMLEEFKTEIEAKLEKLDSDPHFWMPFTLSEPAYVKIMGQKGVTETEAAAHYKRMESFKSRFFAAHKCEAMLGCIDAGTEVCVCVCVCVLCVCVYVYTYLCLYLIYIYVYTHTHTAHYWWEYGQLNQAHFFPFTF